MRFVVTVDAFVDIWYDLQDVDLTLLFVNRSIALTLLIFLNFQTTFFSDFCLK